MMANPPLQSQGTVVELRGLALVVAGCSAAVGDHCRIYNHEGESFDAEVVGFADQRLFLMPIGIPRQIQPGDRVLPLGTGSRISVGADLLGRVVDGRGLPLDDLGELDSETSYSMQGSAMNPFRRAPICEPLDVGVRAINALCTIGRGQRLGLFAGSGVGKSTLLGLMTKNTNADVVVVGLIGERGREVREFVENILATRAAGKSVVVAAPADDPPLIRVHAAWRATTIAEYFRGQGLNVLLLMDSLTRFAHAHREIALSIGEAPVNRGYPASVSVQIPRLLERAGNADDGKGGSITGIYTVLVEGDDQNEPIADLSRSILDGHIVLSRQLAESGLYPAIDIDASISRIMPAVVEPQHLQFAQRFRRLHACYRQNQDLLSIGAYEPGINAELDEAVRFYPRMRQFIQQSAGDSVSWESTLATIAELEREWKTISEHKQTLAAAE